jgi:hypothetical protein
VVENARTCADRTLTLARKRGERGYEAWSLRLMGDIAASHHGRPDVETATACYDAAMTLASELEMRPLLAHCHFGLGRRYRRRYKREQAQAHLTSATAMYGQMEMRFWLEQAQAELRDLRSMGGPFFILRLAIDKIPSLTHTTFVPI